MLRLRDGLARYNGTLLRPSRHRDTLSFHHMVRFAWHSHNVYGPFWNVHGAMLQWTVRCNIDLLIYIPPALVMYLIDTHGNVVHCHGDTLLWCCDELSRYPVTSAGYNGTYSQYRRTFLWHRSAYARHGGILSQRRIYQRLCATIEQYLHSRCIVPHT